MLVSVWWLRENMRTVPWPTPRGGRGAAQTAGRRRTGAPAARRPPGPLGPGARCSAPELAQCAAPAQPRRPPATRAEGRIGYHEDARRLQVEGITLEVLGAALAQAGDARRHILARMAACAPPPRGELAPGAPRIVRFAIDPARIGQMIGAGGKTVRALSAAPGIDAIQARAAPIAAALSVPRPAHGVLCALGRDTRPPPVAAQYPRGGRAGRAAVCLLGLCRVWSTNRPHATRRAPTPAPHWAQVVDQESGLVEVVGSSSEAVALARRTIERLLEDAEVGRIYRHGPRPKCMGVLEHAQHACASSCPTCGHVRRAPVVGGAGESGARGAPAPAQGAQRRRAARRRRLTRRANIINTFDLRKN